MTLLNTIKRKLIESRFKRKNLNIIENVEPNIVNKILADLIAQGWELAPQFDSAASLFSQGVCIIGRGQSTLTFTISPASLGAVVGPARIIVGLADEYGLSASSQPS